MNRIDPSLRYILYARKSSEGEDRQMASVDDQIGEMQITPQPANPGS